MRTQFTSILQNPPPFAQSFFPGWLKTPTKYPVLLHADSTSRPHWLGQPSRQGRTCFNSRYQSVLLGRSSNITKHYEHTFYLIETQIHPRGSSDAWPEKKNDSAQHDTSQNPTRGSSSISSSPHAQPTSIICTSSLSLSLSRRPTPCAAQLGSSPELCYHHQLACQSSKHFNTCEQGQGGFQLIAFLFVLLLLKMFIIDYELMRIFSSATTNSRPGKSRSRTPTQFSQPTLILYT